MVKLINCQIYYVKNNIATTGNNGQICGYDSNQPNQAVIFNIDVAANKIYSVFSIYAIMATNVSTTSVTTMLDGISTNMQQKMADGNAIGGQGIFLLFTKQQLTYYSKYF